MSLYEQIIAVYPDLTDDDFNPISGKINLRNDADGAGDYIAKWDHELSLPKGMKVGK